MSENITLDLTSKTVAAILTNIQSTVKASGKYTAYVAEYSVTRDNLADHARALADAWADKYAPKTERVQKRDGARTPYGNAVQAAGAGLRTALGTDHTAKPVDWIRLVRQAAENAHNKGEVPTDAILAAVRDALAAGE